MLSTVKFPIAPIIRCSSFEQGGILPDISFVEPILRRRLSSLSRVVLGLAHECAHDIPCVRIVFASRHGELARTTTMLDSLAQGESLSPTLFSMSVLNASISVFSMLEKNTGPVTAISAGTASFGLGLLESCVQQEENPDQSVLFIYADESPPEIYGRTDIFGGGAHAVAILLGARAETNVACYCGDSADNPSAESQSRAFVRCFDHGKAEWVGAGKYWFWQRIA